MASTMFMRVDEVAEELGVSVPYAYKLIRSMNAELKKDGLYYHFRPHRPQILPRKILWHKRPERKE